MASPAATSSGRSLATKVTAAVATILGERSISSGLASSAASSPRMLASVPMAAVRTSGLSSPIIRWIIGSDRCATGLGAARSTVSARARTAGDW